MTRIVDWAVNNTRVVLALMMVVVIAGVVAFIRIPKEADPNVPIPIIIVQIAYPGISPEDSERLLVKPMENYLRSIEGLKTMTARAYQGFAVLILEFDVSFQKEKALEDVRAQVETARAELPPDVKQPLVQEFNTSLFPTITVALSADMPERTLLKLARDLRDEVKQIPSVLDVTLGGERQEMLEVVPDPEKLESYGITQAEMFNAIANNNRLIAAGNIDTGHGSFAVKVPAVIDNAQDVLGLPIRSTKDATVTLGDLAQVHRTYYDPTSYARMNGQPTIALEVTKRIGANIIQNNQKVRDVVDAAAKSWPPGIHVDYIFDESKYIENELSSLSDSIILAILLVMIIIVAALGLRSGLLVGVAIPTSFLLAFLVFNAIGLALNFMILFAMLLAVGILVDGAIVVVEYADRKMTEGLPPREAFADAGRRMFWPVVSATATMIGAFLPLLLWPGLSGKYMSYFPITLIVVLGASMFVALIFFPVLGGLFGRPPPRDAQHEKSIQASETGDWRDISGITGWYARLAERLTHHPLMVVSGALAVVAVIVGLYVFFNHGTAFFVDSDADEASILVSARGNLSAAEKRDVVMGVERVVATVDGIRTIYAKSGEQDSILESQGGVPVDNVGEITIELKDYRDRRPSRQIMDEIVRKTAGMPGVRIEVRPQTMGPEGGKDVMIDIDSDDYVALGQVTDAIRRHMDSLTELHDIEDTRPLPGIEWNVDIDRDVANRFGANAQSIGTAIQLVTDGILVGEYRPQDSTQQVDIRVRYPAPARGIHALDDVKVSTDNGMVPASNFVKLVPRQQVNSIERIDAHRVFHVRANVKKDSGILANAETARLKTWVAAQNFPANVHVAFKGADEESQQSGAFLVEAAFLALFLIGIVLLMLFNSFYHTFLVLVAVVLAMVGALLGMLVMGQSFSIVMTGTGMLALAGIVVNHNIVLIDTFHRLLKTGMEPIEAVIRASAQRLRPVFLTTVTAIGGLLPMMLAIEIDFWTRHVTVGGPDAMMWVQLSTAIVFGLAFSKMVTMGLVPAMLAMPYRVHPILATKKGFAVAWRAARHHSHASASRAPDKAPEAQAAE